MNDLEFYDTEYKKICTEVLEKIYRLSNIIRFIR